MRHTLLLLALLGCTREDTETADSADTDALQDDTGDTNDSQDSGDVAEPVDADGDGVTSDLDCNDNDPLVYPGASEQCNEADDDCDGTVDEEVVTRDWFIDADADGWGDASAGDAINACKAPAGRADREGDCDDSAPSVNPAATEVCDGVDDDCDGAILDDTDLVAPLAELQASVCADSVQVCTEDGWIQPDFTLIDGFEAVEVSCDGVDNDCDGTADNLHESAAVPLADNQLGECQDSLKVCQNAAFVEPDYTAIATYEATERTCDGVDNDCNGDSDDVDDDADGHRPLACGGDDCDDTRDNVAPGLPEDGGSGDYAPDGLDNDCDGFADNGLPYGNGSAGDVVLTGDTFLEDIGGESVDVYGVATDSRGLRAYRNGEATIPSTWGAGDEVLLLLDSENYVRNGPEESDTSGVGEWWIGTIYDIDRGLISFVEEPPDLGVFSAQMTRIVQFNNLTLDANATLTGTDRVFLWGGLMPIRVAGTLTLGEDAVISTEGLGYRGGKGAYPRSSSVTTGATGFQGEGRRKILDKLGAGERKWFWNDMGGGGGGLFPGADTNGDHYSCQECRCTGGGGGHYLAPGEDEFFYNGDCGDMSGNTLGTQPNADQLKAEGGLHGFAYPHPANLLWFGGGGGGGSAPVSQASVPGNGGNGGGALWVSARSVVFSESSRLVANGDRSEDVLGLYGYGPGHPMWGGSGAGGTIWMRTGSITLPSAPANPFHDYIQVAGGMPNINFSQDQDIFPSHSGQGMAGMVTLYADSVAGEPITSESTPEAFLEASTYLGLRRAFPLADGIELDYASGR